MNENYSQLAALKALTKGSFKALLKSPSSVFFSIAFPLLFIVAFGVMSDSGVKVSFAFDQKSDTSNAIYQALKNVPIVKIVDYSDTAILNEKFKKGNIAAIINIQKKIKPVNTNETNNSRSTQAGYEATEQLVINYKTSIASGNDKEIGKQVLISVINELNKNIYPKNQTIASIQEPPPVEGRPYRYLDFFLPGMLGFSMLSAGIFGTAFIFFNLRQTLVLKRFFATPVKRIYIIIAEGSSRLILQIIASAIIILVGYFAFDFTLVNGFTTFLNMMFLTIFGLIIFLGMGFVISSIAKSEALIPPLANMITMPQLLLSGVFLSTSNFPDWLQPICNALPLTQLNNALRDVAFQGKSLLEVWQPILILSIWGILVYALAVKVFRWE